MDTGQTRFYGFDIGGPQSPMCTGCGELRNMEMRLPQPGAKAVNRSQDGPDLRYLAACTEERQTAPS